MERLSKPMEAHVPRNTGKARSKRSILLPIAGCVTLLAIIGAAIGALIANNVIHINKKSSSSHSTSGAASISSPTSTSDSSGIAPESASPTSTPKKVKCSTSDDIPSSAKGTWMDPTSWLDMKDFNCTFTSQTIGDLPLVGLNDTWDDSKRPNPDVPPLNSPFGYGQRPFRGVNLGGWLSPEPFITPSLFADDIHHEYAMSKKLGNKLGPTLEKHYSTFITEADFKAIADAGLDHVRIPFSYWAVKHYDDDPYLFGVSWRYLLRGIEWARKNGIRVKLDLHAVPGSQNGWNHSGRGGKVNWIQGPDGKMNAQRSLDIHNMLSKFFTQPRYKNIITFYGLVNEPSKNIPQEDLVAWTKKAIDIVKGNGLNAVQIFSEGMRGLEAWSGKMTGYGNTVLVDVHEYTLFDLHTIGFKHTERVSFVCNNLNSAIAASPNPVMVGEWSQADTDCTKWLNGVGSGARWEGTFYGQDSPACPTKDTQCSCAMANADPSTYTADYKKFLQQWAEAQMDVFEKSSWGWFYWTWKTENAPLWSYQAALKGEFMPAKAYAKDWNCDKGVPSSYGALPEFY
ncbi:beta-glucosidase 6 [Venturia nashicola]|nr:beta-glucosidase 6 [Venturia nashicola]